MAALRKRALGALASAATGATGSTDTTGDTGTAAAAGGVALMKGIVSAADSGAAVAPRLGSVLAVAASAGAGAAAVVSGVADNGGTLCDGSSSRVALSAGTAGLRGIGGLVARSSGLARASPRAPPRRARIISRSNKAIASPNTVHSTALMSASPDRGGRSLPSQARPCRSPYGLHEGSGRPRRIRSFVYGISAREPSAARLNATERPIGACVKTPYAASQTSTGTLS